tara:strand:- start:643 stop:1371 length:729 start_codon:yes stop_codon:yes gene_type:complete
MSEFKFPTEEVELPSKGLLYPKDHPLSSGKVEIKYMTAKEEDILSNQSYIQKGTVLDKLLQSLLVNKDIKTNDLFVGDKNALFVAARILGYGKEYKATIAGKEETIDLSELENRPIDEKLFATGENRFTYKLESTGTVLEFKLLNGHDEKKIERELAGLKKITPNQSAELTTRLKYSILSVDGNEERKDIREFVDNYFLAKDARAFRKYISDLSPDVDMTVSLEGGEVVTVPIGLNFFWPDA